MTLPANIGLLIMLISNIMWGWCLTAWWMCVYIALASREGFKWFSFHHNPYLLLSAALPVLIHINSRLLGVFSVTASLSNDSYDATFISAGDGMNALSSGNSDEHRRAVSELVTPFLFPQRGGIILSTAVWSLYAALVSSTNMQFPVTAHLIPVNIPLAALALLYFNTE